MPQFILAWLTHAAIIPSETPPRPPQRLTAKLLTYYAKRYTINIVIQTFRCKDTQTLYEGGTPKRFRAIADVAIRRLSALDASVELRDLKSPPGNRLESLSGHRRGQLSIRINGQWRVCFKWTTKGPVDVEIIDYH
jgi:proteic killer suppression protein